MRQTAIRDEMIRLRKEGLTYGEIGEKFGVTRQWVHKLIGNQRVRKDSVDIERIVYEGIYQLFLEDSKMTFTKFSSIAFGEKHGARHAQCELIRMLILGLGDRHVSLRIINNILQYIGKPYEEVFRERNIHETN